MYVKLEMIVKMSTVPVDCEDNVYKNKKLAVAFHTKRTHSHALCEVVLTCLSNEQLTSSNLPTVLLTIFLRKAENFRPNLLLTYREKILVKISVVSVKHL